MKLEVKNVSVAKFEEFENHEYVFRCMIYNNEYNDRYCIVNNELEEAIDIENNKRYRIIKKENGRIVRSGKEEIELMIEYGLSVKDIDYSKLTRKEQKELLNKTKKCLENINDLEKSDYKQTIKCVKKGK